MLMKTRLSWRALAAALFYVQWVGRRSLPPRFDKNNLPSLGSERPMNERRREPSTSELGQDGATVDITPSKVEPITIEDMGEMSSDPTNPAFWGESAGPDQNSWPAPVVDPEPEVARRSMVWRVRGLIRTIRPHQWVKNVFVLAPVVFATKLFDVSMLTRASVAFAAFCLLAGAV